MNHRPVAIGLLLCEQVIVDEKTRNLTPVNCFGRRKLANPLKDMRFTARIWDCPFPVPGYYEVVLIVEGEFVAHRRIRLLSEGLESD